VIASAALEIFIVLYMVLTKNAGQLETILFVLNGTGLIMLFRTFNKMVKGHISYNEMITEDHLKSYFENRLSCVNTALPPRIKEEIDKLNSLLAQQILRFAENVLKGWVHGHHFELSIFEDSQHPKIVAYYDSGGESEPRSKNAREKDPNYYENNRYEVVELLKKPGSSVIYIADTHASQYSFVNPEQQHNIKSSLLYCFSNEGPRALVVTCDRQNALRRDPRIDAFVRAVGTALRAEYNLGGILVAYLN